MSEDRAKESKMRVTSTIARLIDGKWKTIEHKVKYEQIDILKFEGETAHVGAKLDRKVSDENYGSIGVEVFLSTPCYPEEMDQVLDFIILKGKKRIEKEIQEIVKGMHDANNE